MAAVRPDVAYDILELDVLKKTDPAWVGRVLRDVMARLSSGELKTITHSRWPLAEAGAALSFMRAARHIGKIVVTTPPILKGKLRQDRTYLVTGGLGGIGCAVADWLADRGAGAIALNGRRAPDPEAEEVIRRLRERGVKVQVEIADVTDAAAIDEMMARIDETLPPLGGVIHSVGVLSDGALTNQSWERFETVLWPKVLGAWHLHRATLDRDLDNVCPLFEPGWRHGQSGPGKPRLSQCISGSTRRAPPRDGVTRAGHSLGSVVGDRRSSGTAGAD